MSYKHDTEIVILNRLSKAGDEAKAELFETYDQLRDLTVSGPSMAGSGLGKVGSFFFKLAQMISGSEFLPALGNQSINIPGTSYFAPILPGTGINPGGQASFGVGPMSQMSGFPAAGSAAPIDALAILATAGVGSKLAQVAGIGDPAFPMESSAIGGTVAGGAAPIGGGQAAIAGGTGTGLVAAAGFGRNWVIPAAGIASGIGGLLTTLGPMFGTGLAGMATGTILSGFAGSVLGAYQHVSNRILVNADTILSNKVKNLETTVRMLDAQQDVVKKLLKESLEGDKKALQDL